MARNTSSGARKGAVTRRTQVFNPATGNYVKRDSGSGQFLSVKTDGKPFKGVVKEKTAIKSNPSIKKATAKKAENAVIAIINRSKDKITITISGQEKSAGKTGAKKSPAKKKTTAKKYAGKKATSSSKTTKKPARKR